MNRIASAVGVALVPLAVSAQGNLETPDISTYHTGIGFVSGWHCSARTIEVQIDSFPRITAGTGTSREDTRGVCGRADTGFGYTINYDDLPEGPHALTAFADGVAFASASFVTINLAKRTSPLAPRGGGFLFES
ncbi:MAG TPA: hypothetical protein VFP44_20315, partial [Usitatibacter sp.]|nr:hypothetical protein [Usitatibacter sp.]